MDFIKKRQYSTAVKQTWIAWVAMFSLLCFLMFGVVAMAQERSESEARIRAGMIIGILRFTTWDASNTGFPELWICSIGKTYSSRVFSVREIGVVINGRKLLFRHLQGNDKFENCNVLLLGSDADELIPGYGNPLTICDGCNVNRTPAMVTLFRQKRRIGFDVDLDLAKLAGLNFSSDMLELAANIKRTP